MTVIVHGLEIRGVLATMKPRDITVVLSRIPTRERHDRRWYSVCGTVTVPDRDNGRPLDVMVQYEYSVTYNDAKRFDGDYETAAVFQWLENVWAHEFKEGVWLLDGTAVQDPEAEHGVVHEEETG